MRYYGNDTFNHADVKLLNSELDESVKASTSRIEDCIVYEKCVLENCDLEDVILFPRIRLKNISLRNTIVYTQFNNNKYFIYNRWDKKFSYLYLPERDKYAIFDASGEKSHVIQLFDIDRTDFYTLTREIVNNYYISNNKEHMLAETKLWVYHKG